MASLTLKAVLHPRQREDGTQQVRIRLTKDRVAVFYDAGFTLLAKHWNKNGKLDGADWVRAGNRSASTLNERLDVLLREARDLGLAKPLLSAPELRDLLAKEQGQVKAKPAPVSGPPTELLAYAAHYARERARTAKPNTVKFYIQTTRDLVRWRSGAPLALAALTREHLIDFQEWMMVRKPKPVFAGTARDRLIKLSTILRAAVKAGVMPAHVQPFADFELPPEGNKTAPRRLTQEQRLQVLGFDLTSIRSNIRYAGFHQALAVRRDIWDLQYQIRGTRCGDILKLREQDVQHGRVSFIETKTGKPKSVARTPAIDALLARYPPTGDPAAFIFPILDHTQPYAAPHPHVTQAAILDQKLRVAVAWVNAGLRVIAQAVGVPVFTSHSARHMFAERAYAVTKDIRIIQGMLNHSGLSTTEKYMQPLGYDKLDEVTAAILG